MRIVLLAIAMLGRRLLRPRGPLSPRPPLRLLPPVSPLLIARASIDRSPQRRPPPRGAGASALAFSFRRPRDAPVGGPMCNARRLLSPLIGGAFALSLAALAPLFTGCGGDDAAAAIGHDGGATQSDFAAPAVADLALGPPQGTIDPMGGGGTVNLLAFTVFGDVRPALPDFDNQYPAMTIASIMKQMATLSPEFAVGTGDYMFVEALPSSATNQLKMLLAAEANFPKPIFHALGNHECNSFSDLNCPNLNETPNITVYMSTMLPWTKVPWYSFLVHTALGDAKFLFVAANAWNDQQAAWLKQALSIPTRYTFVIRHQPTPDAGQPSSVMGKLASDMLFMGQDRK